MTAICAPAQDSLNVSMVGKLDFWDSPRHTALFDNYLYIATYNTGLRVLDVSNPTQPVEVFFSTSTNCLGASYVVIDINVAYLLGNGITTLDITDPAAPEEIGYLGYPNSTIHGYSLAVQGNYGYLGGYQRIYVLDISDPSNIDSIGSCYVSGDVVDIEILGNYAYLCCSSSGLRVVDISIPTQPSVIYYNSNLYTHGIAIANNVAYLACSEGLQIYSLADPAQPQFINSYVPQAIRDVIVDSCIAYLAAEENGLRIVNVANPNFPFELGFYSTADIDAMWITADQERIYLSDWSSGLRVIDASSLFNPIQIGIYDQMGTCTDLVVQSNYSFLSMGDTYGNGITGLVSVDISQYTQPALAGSCLTVGSCYGIALDSIYVFTVSRTVWGTPSNNKLHSVNTSDPNNPFEMGSTSNQTAYMGDMAVANGYAYIACSSNGFQIYNVSNPGAPFWVSTVNITNYAKYLALNGNYAFVTFSTSSGSKGMKVIDISSPVYPVIVGSLNTTATPGDIDVWEDYAYLACGSDNQLIIIDISSPTNPSVVSIITNMSNPYSVRTHQSHLFIGCSEGLKIYNLVNPISPQLEGYYDTATGQFEIEIEGNYVHAVSAHSYQIYYSLNITTAQEEVVHQLPSYLHLSPPFPNPFNPSTVISYQLPVAGPVSLKVYDLSGRLVSTLLNGFKTPGYHEVTFDGSRLASGLYFVRMQAGDFTAVQKLILLK
jgi:hypothetical protein